MLPEEREHVSLFTGAARRRVADQLGCNTQQVHGPTKEDRLSDIISA